MQDANPPRFRTNTEDMKDLGGHQQARWMPAASPIHLAAAGEPAQSFADNGMERCGNVTEGTQIALSHPFTFTLLCQSLRHGVPLTIQKS